jgi:hypothetical protein
MVQEAEASQNKRVLKIEPEIKTTILINHPDSLHLRM